MNYKKLIIKLIKKVENERFLKAIYISISEYLKENNRIEVSE